MSDYTWPANLKLDPGAKKAIEQVSVRYPLLAQWPEDEKVLVADQPKAIADVIIPEFHKEIENAKIAYLFKQTMGSRQRTKAASATVLSPTIHMLSGCNFLITVNWTIWRGMSAAQRTALMDHELEHCGISDEGRYIILSHDLEEFNTIVNRWGMWSQNITLFLDAAKAQLELPMGEKAS